MVAVIAGALVQYRAGASGAHPADSVGDRLQRRPSPALRTGRDGDVRGRRGLVGVCAEKNARVVVGAGYSSSRKGVPGSLTLGLGPWRLDSDPGGGAPGKDACGSSSPSSGSASLATATTRCPSSR